MNFFGYGLSGFSEIPRMVRLLDKLGYKKVVVLADKFKNTEDKKAFEELRKQYGENYRFFEIPAYDIRDKEDKDGKLTDGLCEKNEGGYDVKMKYQPDWDVILKEIIKYV